MLALFCAAVPASGDATEREVRRLELAAHLSMRNGRSIPPGSQSGSRGPREWNCRFD